MTTPIGKGFRSLNLTLRKVCRRLQCDRDSEYFYNRDVLARRSELVSRIIRSGLLSIMPLQS